VSSGEVIGAIRECIEWAALGIEVPGASVIIAGVLWIAITRGTVRYLFQLDKPGAYESYKHPMGCSAPSQLVAAPRGPAVKLGVP
jgi:hypothetical protein